MTPRSQSLNQALCVTIAAVEAALIISVQTKAMIWSDLRTTGTPLKGLPDAEVDSPVARFRFAVHMQIWNRGQLIAEINASRAHRCQISQPSADVISEAAAVVEIQ